MKGKVKLIGFSFLVIMILIQGTPVNAHTPASVTLLYDFSSQVLTVQVSHSVADVNTHYIYQVVVEKNSVVVLTRDYTTQNTTSGMSATYNIPAAHNDVLKATAKCIISGQNSNQITVTDPASTSTTTTTGPDTSPTNGEQAYLDLAMLVAVAIVVIGVVAVVFVFLKRR